jgi:uncharacterized protein with PQ loop repeat
LHQLGEILGFAGGIIGIATGLPQALRIRKQGHHDGLALSPWILMLATFSAYTAYGLVQNSPAIWICNLLTFFTTALVVTAVKGNGFKVWALILIGGAASAGVIVALPPLLSNAALVVLTANRLPQLVRTWLNRKTAMVSAVSISSLLVALTSMTCWGLYAIFTENSFIILTTIVAMSITISTAVLEAHIARLAKKAHLSK